MKIKTRISIGFIFILIIVIGGISVLFSFQQNISSAITYHDMMSIPATNLLLEIPYKLEAMYSSLFEFLQDNVSDDEHHEHAKEKYSLEKSELDAILDEYDELTFIKRDNMEYFAPLVMREMMQNFLNQQKESRDRIDVEIQGLFLLHESGAPILQIQKQIDSLNNEKEVFLKINEKNFQMEIMGKNQQNEIVSENLRNSYIIISLIIVSLLTIMGIIFVQISRNISNPLIRLQNMTKEIAEKGLNVKIKSEGDYEIRHLINTFNETMEYLKKYQEEVIKRGRSEEQKKELEKVNKKLIEKEKIIVKQIKDLKESELLKEEFSSMITHELKTPLTPIKGYCEILSDESFGTLTKDQCNYVEKINSSAIILEQLIGDVLDVQKLDMGKMSFNKESLDVDDFLDRLKQDNSHLMKDKGIEFIVADSLNVTLTSDSRRLRQVLDNLIRNSVDFVPSKNGKIEIGVNKENGKMIFHVKDNGIGIQKDKQANIFKKFYQVDTSYTRKHGGTGLGLVICKGILKRLGGEIWFESESGKGTTFYFSIPMYEEKIISEPTHR